MYQGFEIIDFHSHFPTDGPWFTDMGETMNNYMAQISEERIQVLRERAAPYGEHWRRMWGFPKPEAT